MSHLLVIIVRVYDFRRRQQGQRAEQFETTTTTTQKQQENNPLLKYQKRNTRSTKYIT